MWTSIIFNIIISFILIFLIHQLWNWLKDNYSVKKTKDLVGSQISKYKAIIEELEKNNNSKKYSETTLQNLNVENIDQNIESRQNEKTEGPDLSSMKHDLEDFMDTLEL